MAGGGQQRVGATAGRQCLVSQLLEHIAHHAPDIRTIVDDKHRARSALRSCRGHALRFDPLLDSRHINAEFGACARMTAHFDSATALAYDAKHDSQAEARVSRAFLGSEEGL